MSEITVDLGLGSPPSTPAAPSPAAPDPVAAPAAPAAAAPPPGRGPWNNWGQPVSYSAIAAKPPNYDHSRAPDPRNAPHGWLSNGDPFSPYGTTEHRGRVRTRPVPEMKDRDPCARAQAGVAGERRMAATELKAPASVVGLYAAIDDEHKRLVGLVQEVKRQHPDSKYGIPPHPKAIGEGAISLAAPHFGPGGIADVLTGTTGFLSKAVGDPEAKPSKKTIDEAAEKIAVASRYYGVSTDPKTTATVVAIVAIIMCFLPAALAGLKKLVAAIRGEK